MKISKEELEKRLARESEIFSDYLYLARKMAKHDFKVFYQNLLSHIDVSNGRNIITLENNQFTDYQWGCTVCGEEFFSVQPIIDGLKEVFDFELVEVSERLKKQCAVTSWNKPIPKDDTHIHYRYRLKFKRR